MGEQVFMYSESAIDSLPFDDSTKQRIKAAATASFNSDDAALVLVNTPIGIDTSIVLERLGDKHRLNIGGTYYRVFAKVPPRGFDPAFKNRKAETIDFWQHYI